MLKIKKITKKLEIKQVEFKLGEDCWDMKIKVLLEVQSTACVKVLLMVKVLLVHEEYSKYF